MRVYVLTLMSLDRCRSQTPCIALMSTVIGTIIVCLLGIPVSAYYVEQKYELHSGQSYSLCITEFPKPMGFVLCS